MRFEKIVALGFRVTRFEKILYKGSSGVSDAL